MVLEKLAYLMRWSFCLLALYKELSIQMMQQLQNVRAKKQFEENIYWNRNKEGDIAIRAELINQDSGESIFLARVATIADLSNPDNNAPDNFSIFKLYEISSIDSDKFERVLILKH